MIFAKINPAAEKTYQETTFKKASVTAEYMCVNAEKYPIGGKSVSFEVRYGVLKFNDKNVAIEFLPVIRANVVLTSKELVTWNSDDSIVLDLIAAKEGTVVVEKIQTDLHLTY